MRIVLGNFIYMDVYGKALKDYSQGSEHSLLLNNNYGDPEEMPVWYLFREYEDMPDMEKMALAVCEGHVLDVGAGTGAHALALQQLGHQVKAIDISKEAVEIMGESGVKTTQQIDFFDLKGETFDTIIMLMNGIGFIGKLACFQEFLVQAKKSLNPDGQLIFDSSDIAYLYEGAELPKDKYYGEINYQYEYLGQKGPWFDWVYIDSETLTEQAEIAGWHVYFLHRDNTDQYLVRMIPK